ncbi:5846_t:CDS:2 [Entrophospora sp. SA101]|nr:5846_t:CDS:2 [Entrophospora sp. SA101]
MIYFQCWNWTFGPGPIGDMPNWIKWSIGHCWNWTRSNSCLYICPIRPGPIGYSHKSNHYALCHFCKTKLTNTKKLNTLELARQRVKS